MLPVQKRVSKENIYRFPIAAKEEKRNKEEEEDEEEEEEERARKSGRRKRKRKKRGRGNVPGVKLSRTRVEDKC